MASRQDYQHYILKQINATPYIVDNFLKSDNEEFSYRNSFENIKNNLNSFMNGFDENRFVIMPGLRGVGKSTLLLQTYKFLLDNGIDENRILYVPVDELKTLTDANLHDLINIFVEDIHQRYPATLNEELFILIDEAQEDSEWSQTGKIIYDQSKKIFMIFTGSNALDFELNIDSVRRSSFERVYPLNFQEYLNLKYNMSIPSMTDDILNIFLTGNVDEVSKKELQVLSSTSVIEKPLINEFKHFLSYGAFPFNFNLDDISTHRRIFEVVDRVIEKDVRHYRAFNGNSKTTVFNILSFLAVQKPGGVSVNSMSKNMGVSRSNIIKLLEILEKTYLIFHINPYGGAGKMIRTPNKYYFLSSSINAAINFTLGKHTPQNNDYMGILAETLVASSFFRLNRTISKPNGIFAPTDKGMADFILTTFEGDKIAVEVGFGKKGDSQVRKTMNKYNCQSGVVVSQATELIKKDDEITFLPITTFALM